MKPRITEANNLTASASPRPGGLVDQGWYAAYTYSHHEKRVAEQLLGRSVEHFLPLYTSIRRWKDRRVKLEVPLFPGYVFVRLALQNRSQVLETPGVARLVGFGGLPVALPDHEIEALRNGLVQRLNVEPYRYLATGRRVKILSGPLTGLEGIVLRRKNKFRVVLSLDLIQRSIAVDIDAADVRPIARTGREAGATN